MDCQNSAPAVSSALKRPLFFLSSSPRGCHLFYTMLYRFLLHSLPCSFSAGGRFSLSGCLSRYTVPCLTEIPAKERQDACPNSCIALVSDRGPPSCHYCTSINQKYKHLDLERKGAASRYRRRINTFILLLVPTSCSSCVKIKMLIARFDVKISFCGFNCRAHLHSSPTMS